MLKFDPATEQVVGDDEANRLLRGSYRAPTLCPNSLSTLCEGAQIETV